MKILIAVIALIILLLGIAFLLLTNNPAEAPHIDMQQEEETYPNALYPIRVKGKWGYMNNRKEVVIECTFDEADDFTNGLAAVSKYIKQPAGNPDKALTAYIDTNGTLITEFKYDHAYPFSEGLALVVRDEKYGFIDATGKEVIALRYEDAAQFSEGLAAVKINGKNGFINKQGQIIIEPAFERACYVSVFSEGLAPVYNTSEEGLAGYIDKTGKLVIPAKYGFVDQFSEGIAMVRPLASKNFGYINKTGEWIIQPKFDMSLGFHEGLATVKVRNTDGSTTFSIIDKVGKEIATNLNYNFVGIFREGLAAFEDKNFAWGYIDKSGKEVIAAQFASPKFFVNGLARMETGRFFGQLKITYINKKGQVVWKEK